MIVEWRSAETGGRPTDDAVVDRLLWEYRNVTDGDGLAAVMNALAERYPAKPGSEESAPVLPIMPDLTQALNTAAADSRGVIALVLGSEHDAELEPTLSRLLFERPLAGRSHIARLTADAWAEAKEAGQVTGATLDSGVFFIAPESFGRTGEVELEIPSDADAERMSRELLAALDEFRAEWRKLDRATHKTEGTSSGITWTEYDPDADSIVVIGAGSKKLGRPSTNELDAFEVEGDEAIVQ